MPDAKLYGPDGVAESGFADPEGGRHPRRRWPRLQVTVATLSPDEYPPRAASSSTTSRPSTASRIPDPYAIYGYEAMSWCSTPARSWEPDCSDKQAMIDALFQTKGRESVLGTYDIDENGDTTLTDYGVYTIKGGELEFDEDGEGSGRLITAGV